jgi:hypothetical protein
MKAWGECMAEMDPPAFRFVLDVGVVSILRRCKFRVYYVKGKNFSF